MFSNTWFLIIINILISIIIIYGAHEFWNYLKDNYSKKRTKDLVGTQIEKYKRMVGEIQNAKSENDGISKEDFDEMENELSRFIQNQY
jgi:hypothetical protein